MRSSNGQVLHVTECFHYYPFQIYVKLACPLETCAGTKILPTPALRRQRCRETSVCATVERIFKPSPMQCLKSRGGARWTTIVRARWTINLTSHNGFNHWVIPKMFKYTI